MISRTVTASVLAALTIVLLACSGGGQDVERTIDVAALTFEDVQQRALAATERPGQVFHITATSGDVTESPSQAWVDRERNLGRAESSRGLFAPLAIYHDEYVAALSPSGSRRFEDSLITSGVPASAFSVHALDYLVPLFTEEHNFVRRELRAATHDGAPVIVAEIETDVHGSNDRRRTRVREIWLDESFLPVKIEKHQADGSRATVSVEYEFVPRDSLPGDFFSVEHVRAQATTPLDDLDAARNAGLDPYWLGEQFEDMVLRDESHFGDPGSLEEEEQRVLRLSYAPPGDGIVIVPCVSMSQHSGALARNDGDLELITLELHGATATIFEEPNTGIPLATLVAGSPRGPDLPDVPDDTGQILKAIVEIDSGGGIEVSSNCGPLGSNIYRTLEAFERLVRSLRPYDGP